MSGQADVKIRMGLCHLLYRMPFSLESSKCPLYASYTFHRCLLLGISSLFCMSTFQVFPLAVTNISGNPFLLPCPPCRVHYTSQVSYERNFHINKPPDYRAFCIQNICRFLSVHALRRFWFDSILDGICKVIAAY